MPLVRPFHEVILFIAIPFLGFADKLVVIAFDLLQVVVGKLAIFLFQLTFELHPFSLELIRVHDVSLLCEIAMPPCPYRSVPVICKPPSYGHYGEKTDCGLVRIAHVARIDWVACGAAFALHVT